MSRTKGARTVSGTRELILEHAMDIASAEGLEGVTIGRLATELKMSKSGLFAHFGSKVELQLATVNAARHVFEREIVEYAFRSQEGLTRLMEMLERWIGYIERRVFRGGCFFAAASAEFELAATVDAAQLAFELHAMVQEANWAHELLEQADAFQKARKAIRDRLSHAATSQKQKTFVRRKKI